MPPLLSFSFIALPFLLFRFTHSTLILSSLPLLMVSFSSLFLRVFLLRCYGFFPFFCFFFSLFIVFSENYKNERKEFVITVFYFSPFFTVHQNDGIILMEVHTIIVIYSFSCIFAYLLYSPFFSLFLICSIASPLLCSRSLISFTYLLSLSWHSLFLMCNRKCNAISLFDNNPLSNTDLNSSPLLLLFLPCPSTFFLYSSSCLTSLPLFPFSFIPLP